MPATSCEGVAGKLLKPGIMNRIIRRFVIIAAACLMISPANAEDPKGSLILTQAPEIQEKRISLHTNLIPWTAAIANLKGEIAFASHWSAALDIWYCPWKISDRYSVKIISLLPEVRWWPKGNEKGHFLDLHFSAAWYNVRFKSNRYQDDLRPLLGGGIGYGYRLPFNHRWGMEFSIGVGYVNTRFNRYYNVVNGALADTKITAYWGIDRVGISFYYDISNL